MRKLFFIVFAAIMLYATAVNAFVIEYDGQSHEYTGTQCNLKINDIQIKTPAMPPIILNDRTLVPVRELCEEIGAKVTYIPETKEIIIELNNDTIIMNIGINTTLHNGTVENIPDGVTPKLINFPGEAAKTMVPVRYIAEAFGMTVDFDSSTGSVLIYTQTYLDKNAGSNVVINNVDFNFPDYHTINLNVYASGNYLSDISFFTLTNPTRVVVDVPKTVLGLQNSTIPVVGSDITGIRFGHEGERTRIVIDVTGDIFDFTAKRSGNKISIYATTKTPNLDAFTPKPEPTPVPESNQSVNGQSSSQPLQIQIPQVNPENAAKKIIVLDAGHGGDDGGASSSVLGYTINEKDITLSIVKKVRDLLTANGYSVMLTRESDTYPTLTQRAELANSVGAAIFVSIHMNSATTDSAHGTETYYASLNNDTSFGTTSKKLASNIQTRLKTALGSRDRGVKTSNHAVTRKSLMPAALVEVGFISNVEEASLLVTDSYQNKAAGAIAEGIAVTWKDVVIPSNIAELAAKRNQALNEWENSN